MSATRVAVLLYHNVANVDAPGCRGLVVRPGAFISQMKTLSALGFSTISPGEWAAHVKDDAKLPKRPIMLTFDDAYLDLVANVFPVLQSVGFGATVFVPTSLLGKSIQCRPDDSQVTMSVMSSDDIVTWSNRGMEFGAHTRSHADLTQLDAREAADEIQGSRADLSAITGKVVQSFAYPFGRVNDAAVNLAGELFDAAFTVEEGMNDSSTPLSTLRRTMVQHKDSVMDVCLRAAFGTSVLSGLRTAVRARKTIA